MNRASSVVSDELTYALGTYKGIFYFVQEGRFLSAHDGESLVEFGDMSNYGVGEASGVVEEIRLDEGKGDALYFTAIYRTEQTEPPFYTERKYYRISEDSGLVPVKVIDTTSIGTYSSATRVTVDNQYYFNGLDHYGYQFYFWISVTAQLDYRIIHSDNSVEGLHTAGYLDFFIEDRGRLFAITKSYVGTTNQYLSGSNFEEHVDYKTQLFVLDNKTNEYVELETCE